MERRVKEVSHDKTERPPSIVGKEKFESAKIPPPKNEHQNAPSVKIDTNGEVSMEASITTDDVVRAGGFGARDDIGCFLPAASDSTDFEATILDAREYEEQEPQGEITRPGLGWK